MTRNNVCLSFLAVGAVLCFVSGCKDSKNATPAIAAHAVKVETQRLTVRKFQKKILVQGTIKPVDSASIAARVAGTIDFLKVKEGSRVKKGDVLFQTDRRNLENKLTIAEKELKVSEETYVTAKMDVEIAKTNLTKTKLDYARAMKLLRKNVISQDAFEQAETAWKNAIASLDKSKAVLRYTATKEEKAKASLDIARKNLEDSIIRAPYNGIITAKNNDPGEYVRNGEAVLEMENQAKLEISSRISAIYYEMINPKTKVIISFNGREYAQTMVSYCSPSIDPLSRTFEIKATLPEDCRLVSGMLCDVQIVLAERSGVGVPNDAILPRKGGAAVVFVVKDKKAEQIDVKTGFSTDGFTELLNSQALANKNIVVSGQYFLNNGSPVVTEPRR